MAAIRILRAHSHASTLRHVARKHITLYTDGACSGNPGPGGWAGLLMFNGHERVVTGAERETTNNRMELAAVVESLRVLKEPCKEIGRAHV